jgi:hypothetical protein
VANDSGASIEQVVISGVGFTEPLGAIADGASVDRSINCGAESGLSVSFQVASTSYYYDDLAYIESCGAYRVRLSIKPDRSVAVVSEMGY